MCSGSPTRTLEAEVLTERVRSIKRFEVHIDGSKVMNSHTHLREQYVFQRHQEFQREMEQRRLLAGLPRHHRLLARCLAAKVGGLLMTLRSSLKRLEGSRRASIVTSVASKRRLSRSRRLAAQSSGDSDLRGFTSTQGARKGYEHETAGMR